MNPKKFALIGGLAMLSIGLISLIPSLSQYSSTNLPMLYVDKSYGLFLGIFPMNIFNKVALILFGVAGLIVSRPTLHNLPSSILYARWVFAVMSALAILGIFQKTNTLNGYWPLFGASIWLHAIFAVMGAYFGFALTRKAAKQNGEIDKSHIRAA